MAERRTRLQGQEFITKILEGERDFSGIRLEPYFDLSGHESFPAVQQYLKDADLEGTPVILDGADLRGLDADGLHLPFLKATGASFKHATLMEANLQSSRLRNANFRFAMLPQIDMTHCDLQDADLRHADLNLALLNNTVLTGTNVAGANLLFTNLQAANIKGIVNLAQARSVETVNFQFVSLAEREKGIIQMELWAQQGKKRRLFGGSG
ncbi:MAG: hypothetical protein DRP79_04505 [Planctomycetota bacterium]|nr:MAG: hypothetical protein DRP79_04505 [Planctomycetota bacterium]